MPLRFAAPAPVQTVGPKAGKHAGPVHLENGDETMNPRVVAEVLVVIGVVGLKQEIGGSQPQTDARMASSIWLLARSH